LFAFNIQRRLAGLRLREILLSLGQDPECEWHDTLGAGEAKLAADHFASLQSGLR
jgi:hypothetical protein